MSQIYNLSLYQVSPEILRAKQAELPWHAELAATIGAEDLQLYYQIGLIGKRDLALAPDPRTGFEMVLLRMIAFRPGAGDNGRTTARPEPAQKSATPEATLRRKYHNYPPPPPQRRGRKPAA